MSPGKKCKGGSDIFDASRKHFNAHLRLKVLMPELPLRVVDNLDVPLDIVGKMALKIAEVLRILIDQVSVTVFPLKGSLHTTLVL